VRELAMQEVMEQKSHYETSLNLQLKAVDFFYGGNTQMNHPARVAMAVPQLTGDTGSALGSAPVFRSRAARITAPTFDEVKYQSSINVVFEIINEE
jgi:hypothetical protein